MKGLAANAPIKKHLDFEVQSLKKKVPSLRRKLHKAQTAVLGLAGAKTGKSKRLHV